MLLHIGADQSVRFGERCGACETGGSQTCLFSLLAHNPLLWSVWMEQAHLSMLVDTPSIKRGQYFSEVETEAETMPTHHSCILSR